MSEYKKCPKCGGSKFYFPLGRVKKECPECFGIGQIIGEMEQSIIEEVEAKQKKKAGRPKRTDISKEVTE